MASSFSMWRGSPPHRLASRLGLAHGGPGDRIRMAVAAALLGWVPYLLIGGAQALWTGAIDPLLYRPEHHARWLITFPAIALSNLVIEREIRSNLDYISEAGILPKARLLALRDATDRAALIARGSPTWAALTIGAFAAGLPLIQRIDSAVAGWHALVAMPLFRVLLAFWLLRWLLWGGMLLRFALLQPRLLATHPDGAGGLTPLGTVTIGYGVGAFGFAGLLAVAIAEEMRAGASLLTFLPIIGTWVVVAMVLAALPSITLLPVLLRQRRRARVEYSAFLYAHGRAFERKWIGRRKGDEAVGHPDFSALADAISSYEPVRTMRIIPLSREHVLETALLAVLPLLPLVALEMPLSELLQVVLGALL